MTFRLVRMIAVWTLAAAACSRSVAPHEALDLRTAVIPTAAALGDTVTLLAIITNPTHRTVEAGRACGPPALFEFRNQAGGLIHPIPLDGIFTCPGLDYHVLEPFETDTVMVRWRITLTPGAWSARSGFRSATGLVRLSDPVSLSIRTEP